MDETEPGHEREGGRETGSYQEWAKEAHCSDAGGSEKGLP
jgi:hypothetical protein